MEAGAAVRALAAMIIPVSSTVPLFLRGMCLGLTNLLGGF
jgi:hypothetical protein